MMKSIKIIALIITSIVIMGSGCKDDELISEINSCKLTNIIKTTTDLEGTIWFNSSLNSYAIYVGISGTYDTQDVGIVCNLPEKYKVDGQKIVFSGNYAKYDQVIPLKIPGQIFYVIELTKISTIDNLKK